MAQLQTKVPGITINLPPQRRSEVTFALATNPTLEAGDTVEFYDLWLVESLTVDSAKQEVAAVLTQPVAPAVPDIPIRTNVKAQRKAVSMVRDLLAEKFPGVAFSDGFVFNMTTVVRQLGYVTAGKMIADKLSEFGIPDEKLNQLTASASEELTQQIAETLRLWPGVSEGQPVLPV